VGIFSFGEDVLEGVLALFGVLPVSRIQRKLL
jgi:hypothetical protein